MGLEFDKRRVDRAKEDQAMNPIVGTHTEEQMSTAKERKKKDTMREETNCNSSLAQGEWTHASGMY